MGLQFMQSGITGLKAEQNRLNVIGNNVANSNTTGFKGQSVNFQDNISQAIKSATGASRSVGGTNPETVGLGVSLASITNDMSQGAMSATNRNLDCGIDGDGYFMVATGPEMDSEEDCIKVDPSTHKILTTPTGTSISYSRDGSFALDNQGNLLTADGHRVLGYSMIGRNLMSASGATKTYGDVVSLSRNQGSATISSGAASSIVAEGSTDFIGSVSSVTGRAFDPAAPASATINAGEVGFVNADDIDLRADGKNLHTLKIPDSVKEIYFKPGATRPSVKTVKIKSFSVETDGVIKATLDDGRVAALGQIAMATFTNTGGLDRGGSNLLNPSANSGDAIIRAGSSKEIKSTDAAVIAYNNSYKNINNGDAYGKVRNGYLEMSNVDLAKEFTDMIVASRSYQANSKTITQGDTILQTLVGLVR